MREYFEAEMRLLREAAQKFAEAYPEIAGQLNLKSLSAWDPSVERLLEGTAYLTAQIQQRIDDDIPEICETLLMQLWPQFLRPFPSATIMQFQPQPGQLQQVHSLAKGVVIQSHAVGESENKIICQFRTTHSVAINPLRIIQVNLEDSNTGGSLIKIQLQTEAGVTFDKLNLNELNFYIYADAALALHTYYALMAGVQKVTASFDENIKQSSQVIGGQEVLKPSDFVFEDALLPTTGGSFVGFHLLQEYFAFQEKYLFVTLTGLEKIHVPVQSRLLEIAIQTKISFPKEYRVKKDIFQLNCIPAINIFAKTSEPIKLTQRRTEYPLVADAADRDNILLYSVDKVIGVDDNTGKQREYAEFNSFSYRRQPMSFYHLTQRITHKKYPTTFLAVGGTEGIDSATLSCAISATNGHHPRRFLQENTLTIASKGLPEFIKSRNILQPSAMLLPPQREHFRWALISNLSINLQTIMEITKLKELLNLYDWTERHDNQRRIAGLRELRVKHIRHIHQGALMQGLEFTLILQEDFYASIADIYLFSMILHKFFLMYAPINMVVITKILCQPSNKELLWQSLIQKNF